MNFKNERCDIIIQAGQSNSEGCGIGPAAKPYVKNDNVWFMNSDLSIVPAGEHHWDTGEAVSDFSLSFSEEYLANGDLPPGRKLLILRSAVGGTGFCDKRWGMKDDLYLKMMEMIQASLALNKENRLVALLWHQGETDTGATPDAGPSASRDRHFANLSGLVKSVRETFGCPDLPFVAGDFVNEWKSANIAACEPVVSAIKDVCDKIGSAGFVETADLPSNNQAIGNGDTIHFCREAQYTLGRRYYKAFKEIGEKQ